MCEFTFEVFQTIDSRPLPFREGTRTVVQNVASVVERTSVETVSKLDFPDALEVVPCGTYDLCVGFDVLL